MDRRDALAVQKRGLELGRRNRSYRIFQFGIEAVGYGPSALHTDAPINRSFRGNDDKKFRHAVQTRRTKLIGASQPSFGRDSNAVGWLGQAVLEAFDDLLQTLDRPGDTIAYGYSPW